MESIHTIAHVQLVTQDQTVNTKLTSVIQDRAKMVEHAPITTMTIRAIVLMDSLEKTVLSMSIGVHKIRVKMVLPVRNAKTPTNATVC